MKKLFWTDEEIEILKKYYPTGDMDEIKKMLPRFTFEKIVTKANQLGLKRKIKVKPKKPQKVLRWSKEETEKLKQVYSHTTNEELLEIFPRFDLKRIRYKARKLGLEKLEYIKKIDEQERLSKMRGDSEWSDDELKILKENYRNLGAAGLVRLLPNRTRDAIASKAHKLGLITEKEAYWNLTEFKFSDKDIFSIKVTFERMDI